MSYETIIYEKEDGVGIVTLNRPHRLNALSAQLIKEMNEVIDEIAKDDKIGVMLITGSGRAFCAGADIEEVASGKMGTELGRKIFINRLEEDLDKPVIAAVNGIATGGGCETVLACDMCIASTQAKFGMGEINIGLLPGAGGTQRLPRLVGMIKAKEMLYTGAMVDAEEAYRIGLVNKVVSPELLIEEAKKLAKVLAGKPAVALRMAKSCVNVGMQMDMSSALEYESKVLKTLFETEDSKEGTKAFIEKRKPVFKGR